jgi:hypothetical protein
MRFSRASVTDGWFSFSSSDKNGVLIGPYEPGPLPPAMFSPYVSAKPYGSKTIPGIQIFLYPLPIRRSAFR